jgi:ribokinase
MQAKVLVIGSLNYDIIFQIDHAHAIGENIIADKVNIASGGKGANQAVQCAKLGLETYMAGCIGNDEAGNFLYKNLEKYGVKTNYLKKASCSSGMSAVNALPEGKVYATISRGANDKIKLEDIEEIAPFMDQCGIVILQLEIPVPIVVQAVKLAKENNCVVILNAAPAFSIPESIISMTGVFVVNEVEAGFYAGVPINSLDVAKQQAKRIAEEYGCKTVFTLGKDGAVVSDGHHTARVPAIDVPAIETTGAGDSFIGGIAYGLINSFDVFEAAKFASYCSAVTIGSVGAQSSMPNLAQIDKLLKNKQG